MHGRRRGKPDLLADLANGGRVAVPIDVLDEVVPDLLLAGGEHRALLGGRVCVVERVFERRVESPSDVVNCCCDTPGVAKEHWKDEPDDHDFPAATDYLSLLFPERLASAVVDGLHTAPTIRRKAKDLLRASRLPLLPREDVHVKRDLKRVAKGQLLSPVLLVRGRAGLGTPLIVADGYHRICASYYLDEDADVHCRLVDAPA